jgi:hypothetical protein
MLHTRRFISYHGARFDDRSLVLEDDHGHVVAILPAAVDPAEPGTVSSHPGLTYGGLLHDGSVRGESLLGCMEAIAAEYRCRGFRRLRYKAVPSIYERGPSGDDIYGLFRMGARWHRCDLSAAIDLSRRGRISGRRARSHKRAERAGLPVEVDWRNISEFWRILELNLAKRYGTTPVHTIEEINLLHERFPDEIVLVTAGRAGHLVAGGVFFLAGHVLHMQYTAVTDEGRAVSATDLVMERGITMASERGCRYFDFGISTVDGGWGLNQDLYYFKVSFGAGGAVYNHYEVDLQPPSC